MPLTAPTSRLGSQAVVAFYGLFYTNNDLTKYFTYSGLPTTSTIPDSNVFGDLPNDPGSPGDESSLDTQVIMSLAYGVPTYFYSMGGINPNIINNVVNEDFLTYLYVVGNQTSPPLVHSLSYGDVEAGIFADPSSINYATR